MGYIEFIREKIGKEEIILNFAGACIFDDAGNVLLQRRRGRIEAWGFPGGAMELGESVIETVAREVIEETGYRIKDIILLGVYSKYFHEYSNGDRAQTVSIFFKCKHSGQPSEYDGVETLGVKWCALDDVPPLFCLQHNDVLNDLKLGVQSIVQ